MIIKGDKVTPYGERACEIVYEHLTGKCWHVRNPKVARTILPDSHYNMIGCIRCHEMYADRWTTDIPSFRSANPPLAWSLDAWVPIFEGMSDEQWYNFSIKLNKLDDGSRICGWINPVHILEAALQLTVPCDKCGGSGRKQVGVTVQHGLICHPTDPCPHCKDGLIKLADILEG